RMRVLAAGSMGNFILALLALGLFFISAPIVESHIDLQGVEILNVTNPAINLVPGDLVIGINGHEVKDLSTLVEAMEGIETGQEIEIETANGTVIGTTIEVDGRVMLGIVLTPKVEMTPNWRFAARIVGFLLLLFNLNLGVGIINLLPAGFLDGGRMIEDLMGQWGRRIGKVALFLLLINIFLPYLLLLSG
ncbi:MAG: site-2 protease family protein, partial [Candidatus Altiarchaeota archaeon]|nr:site-2 protease family protein [Candidatus Altiarchaeota archaeon]